MNKGDYLAAILRSPKTILTFADILLLWEEQNSTAARVRLTYYVKRGDLYRIRRGLYVKNKAYNKTELATRIFTPAYVSFETVLANHGVIFQFYSQIFVASYLAREIAIDKQQYVFKKIKNTILTNPDGIEHDNEISIATKERAFLDTLYVYTNYYFDNLGGLDWEKIYSLLPIYQNKRMAKKVDQLYIDITKK